MKKLLLSLGTVAAAIAPIATVVACGGDEETKPESTGTITDGKAVISVDASNLAYPAQPSIKDTENVTEEENEAGMKWFEDHAKMELTAYKELSTQLAKDEYKTADEVEIDFKIKVMDEENSVVGKVAYKVNESKLTFKLSDTNFETLGAFITGITSITSDTSDAEGIEYFAIVVFQNATNDQDVAANLANFISEHGLNESSIEEVVAEVQAKIEISQVHTDSDLSSVVALTDTELGEGASTETTDGETTIKVNTSSDSASAAEDKIVRVFYDVMGFDETVVKALIGELKPIQDKSYSIHSVELVINENAGSEEETFTVYLREQGGTDEVSVNNSNLTFGTANTPA